MDASLGYLLFRAAKPVLPDNIGHVMGLFVSWLLFTKIVKLLPHFYRYPGDIKFIPEIVLFGYFHGLIKIYALFTLHQVRYLYPWKNITLIVLDDLGRTPGCSKCRNHNAKTCIRVYWPHLSCRSMLTMARTN